MRLDKYLKQSRLIKRRTVAKDAALGSFIYVNDEIKKPSYIVKIGDTIKIKFKLKELIVKVTSISNLPSGDLMYELISENKIN